MQNPVLDVEQGSGRLSKLATAVLDRFPASLQRRLRTPGGRRLLRFAPAALVALAASQITYFICTNIVHTTGRVSGLSGWLAGMVVSYVATRWAWERRGRPRLISETVPFMVVALANGAILTEVSHFAYRGATSMGLHGVGFGLFTQALFLAANFVTFCFRFVIFNSFIFRTKGRHSGRAPVAMTEAD